MSFLAKLLGVFVASTNHTPAEVTTNVFAETSGVSGVTAAVMDTANPAEQELQSVLAEDDAAQAEVDKWIKDNQSFMEKGGGLPNEELTRRIEERFKKVQQAYINFLTLHPDHAGAHIAYGSFLSDTKDEESAAREWEKARDLDPKNPAVWNNLANYHGHRGPVTNAFIYYAKAIELNPLEPVYYHNFGTTVYLFRKDSMEFFHLDEQQVFDKAFDLYAKAQKLDPENFLLATDIAQTYYGVKPMRAEAALQAWTNALSLARDEIEREGVYIHLARIKLDTGNLVEARAHLDGVTNGMYDSLKARMLRNLDSREGKNSAPTNESNAVSLEGTNLLRMEFTPTLRDP